MIYLDEDYIYYFFNEFEMEDMPEIFIDLDIGLEAGVRDIETGEYANDAPFDIVCLRFDRERSTVDEVTEFIDNASILCIPAGSEDMAYPIMSTIVGPEEELGWGYIGIASNSDLSIEAARERTPTSKPFTA